MFTGIIEELGTVVDIVMEPDGGGARLAINGPLVTSDTKPGASIAVNGACLTVVDLPGDGVFSVDLMPETLRRTSLAGLRVGSQVNLERAMPADGRLDGHIVQGHVDGVATLTERTETDGWVELRFDLPDELAGYVAEKGGIAVEGVSLTVTTVGHGDHPGSFGIALIPETLARTTFGTLDVGARVNVEIDVVARYVARLLETGAIDR